MNRNKPNNLRLALGIALGLMFVNSVFAQANDRLSELRAVQTQVQSVVGANMEACVAITDGIGFGSGVIVSDDGIVLTAGHVISSRRKTFEIIFPSGKRVLARRLGMNLNVDAGMLRIIDAENLPVAKLAKADPKPGEWTVSLGHSGGFELGRKPPVRTGKYLRRRGHQMVTDAVLIGGDSGGPLFNLNGELIGIHSSIGGTIAENRHVRIDEFIKHWDRLEDGDIWGKLPSLKTPEREKITKRPLLGITVDKKQNNGRVMSVSQGSPAADVGIRPEDIVLEFDGDKIESSDHLIELVKLKEVGDICSITILRNGKQLKFNITMRTLDE